MQKVEYIDITKLKVNERNPRTISETELNELAKSIQDDPAFFEARPILCTPDMVIYAGTMRYQAAKKLGWEQVPVAITSVDEKTKRMRMLKDNRHKGSDNWDILLNDFDIDELLAGGFKEDELSMRIDNRTDDDVEDDYQDEPYEQVKAKTDIKPGDMFQLGDHRILCGDATKAEDYAKLMDGAIADSCVTDPPYNVNVKSSVDRGGAEGEGIMNDKMTEEAFVQFSQDFTAQIATVLKPGATFYMFSGYSSYPVFLYAIKAANMHFAGPIVWVKPSAGMGWNDYRHQHEMALKGKKEKSQKKKGQPIMYGWKDGQPHFFPESRFEADVWEFGRRAVGKMIHPTQKPLALIQRCITNGCKVGEIVVEPFCGSGSTLVACEQTKRKCYAMELDPVYVQKTINRWQALTGKEATKV